MVHLKFFPHSNPIKHFEIPCAVLPKITCKLPQVKINVSQLRLPTDIILANPEFNIPSEIHIPVGADLYYKLLTPGIIDLGKKLPSLQNTSLGWMIAGTIPNSASFNSVNIQNNDSVFTSCNHISISNKDLSSSLSKFWEQEEIPSKSILSSDDELVETIFQNSTQILENGRFQVNFPLKSEKEHHKLGESFLIAKRRFLSLENRIHKNPELFSEYSKFISEYVNLGHAKYVTLNLTNSKNELKYFIPHLCVIREQSLSTKLRVVFDSSCPTSTGVSLNDITLKGYQVQPDLFDILCRFRLNKFAITSDVQKMFRQISINTEHRFLQNILWQENPQQPLQCIELSTLTYGCNFSPFVATRVLQEIANNNSFNFSLAANALISETYMDDIISGTNSEHELIKLIQELKIVLGNHGFNLHKCASNNSNVLAEISDSNNSSFLQNPEKRISLDLENSQNKVLGLNWLPASDNLNISVPTTFSIFPATKRKILSTISRCFDPLGLYNPIILSGKLLVKQLWQAKLDWDTEISDSVILEKWHTFVNNLPKLSQLTIPRFIFLDKSINLIEMHGFSDASLKAFGACVYLRTIYSDNSVSCNLISATSRVSPVSTTITLPRLELSAMLLLYNLVDKIYKNFQTKINIISVNLWSDRDCWRNGEPSRWTVFVCNRYAKIQAITKDHSWRYVNTIDNPADLVSRGTSANNLISNKLWWHGPKFLSNPTLDLSKFDNFAYPNLHLSDIPETKTVVMTTPTEENFLLTLFSKFSCYKKLQRTMAYVHRFIRNFLLKEDMLPPLQWSTRRIIETMPGPDGNVRVVKVKTATGIYTRAISKIVPFLESDESLLGEK
ncbi:uncharacterized protein LOC130445821 [Diorhabda sublineata]|uniref:uncharacterized protein LOC130445821 n=1 Tax=Diorhabda sublineata TaxID=1163346 RepID=UPI0024E0E0C3|nr:uncharacterized protein LOC130445821 [Diorhabda sublineata]